MKRIVLSLFWILGPLIFDLTAQNPPVSPKWVFEPWIWEDSQNNKTSTLSMINGYKNLNIPVGAIILDSPWQEQSNPSLPQSSHTGYNTFIFESLRYNNPKDFIDSLNAQGIKVILWITGVMTTTCPLYTYACNNNYFVNDGISNCTTTGFWKGNKIASHIDFFNPAAVSWWQGLMDRVFDSLEVDGWKVDQSDIRLEELSEIHTAAGIKTRQEYTNKYYTEIYNYTILKRGEKGMISARPYCDQADGYPASFYAPKNVCSAGWVGDQQTTWDGLRLALKNIFISADAGYSVIGSDIGGYLNNVVTRNSTLFKRWVQMSALMPIMENGGQIDNYHFPWLFSTEMEQIYLTYATLHHELVPYLYSYNITANQTGIPIIRPIGEGSESNTTNWIDDWRYLLGDNIFCAAFYNSETTRSIEFPPGTWIDYWNEDNIFNGGTVSEINFPHNKYPIFIKSGAIIPLNVENSILGHGTVSSKGKNTFLIYPDNSESSFEFNDEYNFDNSTISSKTITCIPSSEGYSISFSSPQDSLIIRFKNRYCPDSIVVDGTLLSNIMESNFDSTPNCWYHTTDTNYTWIKYLGSSSLIKIFSGLISNLSPSNYSINILNEGNKYYIDRDYTLIDIPDKFEGLKMIKTANDDKDKDSISLNFNFDIKRSANIYIAFDHRLLPPSWLTEYYNNTGLTITVSDNSSSPLNIYKRTITSPTKIYMGSNESTINDQSMFFVFVADTATELISNLSPIYYELTNLEENIEYYTDRSHTTSAVPNEFKGLQMIRTANNDKTNESLEVTFNLNKDANIYIAFDQRITPPSWLSSNFKETEKEISVSDIYANPFKVWTSTFSAGLITLGPNGTTSSESAMYFIFFNDSYIKAFLEGCYSGGKMNSNLTVLPTFPTSQPYSGEPWNYSGTESITEFPSDVVDWILVELRDSSNPSSIIHSRAAFILESGYIVDIDGCNLTNFEFASENSFYIALRHRNHLGIMSKNPVQYKLNSLEYDFTKP